MNKSGYLPGPAYGARIKQFPEWTLILERELKHAPEKVWRAITDPEHLRQWAPYDVDSPLTEGARVKLTVVGAPTPQVSETTITRAEAPRVLEYCWGEHAMRWELEPHAGGTRLTLWHNIDGNYVAMGAAGWHICFDVLAHLLDGDPLGRIVGGAAMQYDFKRLMGEYAALS